MDTVGFIIDIILLLCLIRLPGISVIRILYSKMAQVI